MLPVTFDRFAPGNDNFRSPGADGIGRGQFKSSEFRMRHPRIFGIASLAVVAAATVAFAQSTVTALPEEAPVQTAPLDTAAAAPETVSWGDAKRGAALAGTCSACHGLDGNPVDPQYPRIAGQSERYVARQLALYKSGERNTGRAMLMVPFATLLTPQNMRDLGAHFASQKAGAGIADDTLITDPASPYNGMKFYEAGEQLFRRGDASRGIAACMACHGPAGAGNPGPPYPHIAGQLSSYSVQRLQEYRAGETAQQDPHLFNIMADVAKHLTDEEIQSLASYLQGLHDRADEATAEEIAKLGPIATPAPAAPAAPAVDAAAPAATADAQPTQTAAATLASDEQAAEPAPELQ